MAASPLIRPLEPEDAPGMHALLTGALAARAGTTPFDPPALAAARVASTPTADVHRFGRFDLGRLVGFVALEPRAGSRTRHVAGVRLVSEPHLAAPLLDVALDLAWRWLNIDRVEIDLLASDPLVEWLQQLPRPFRAELRRPAHRVTPTGLEASVHLGCLREGFDPPAPCGPVPAWPARRPRQDGLVVRVATPADATVFAATMREPEVRWGTLQVASGTDARWRARLHHTERDQGVVFVAELGGGVVGSAGLHPEPFPAHRAAMLGMGIAAAAQGCGVGRALLIEVIGAARWLGLGRIGLEVYPDNLRAIALYSSFGFRPEGVRRAAAWRDGEVVDSMGMGLLL